MNDKKNKQNIDDPDFLLQFSYFDKLSREERQKCLQFLQTYCRSVIEIMEKQIENNYEEDTS